MFCYERLQEHNVIHMLLESSSHERAWREKPRLKRHIHHDGQRLHQLLWSRPFQTFESIKYLLNASWKYLETTSTSDLSSFVRKARSQSARTSFLLWLSINGGGAPTAFFQTSQRAATCIRSH